MALRKLFILVLLLLFLLPYYGVSQQNAYFSQFMFTKYQINPAFGGLESSLSLTAAYRNQWSAIEGNPVTQHIDAHMPLYFLKGSVGISLTSDKLGAESNLAGGISYNMVQSFPFGLVSFGARLGLVQKIIDGNVLRAPDGIYIGNTIDHNDPLLSSLKLSGVSPSWSLGAYVVVDDFEGGLSFGDFPVVSLSVGEANIEKKEIMTGYFQYNYLLNDDIMLHPSLLLRSDFVQTQIDIHIQADWQKRWYGGLGVRGYSSNTLDAIVMTVGLQWNKHYRLSYSYDLGISGLRSVQEDTHEIILNYNLRKKVGGAVNPKIIYNPRFL